jgi:microcystin-dependent protein
MANRIDFTISGGYPLVQDTLRFMQDAWSQEIKALSRAFNLQNTFATQIVILSGCETTIQGSNITIAEGYVSWYGGEVMYVKQTTLLYSAGNPIYLNIQKQGDPVLNPTYYSVTGQVNDSHVYTFLLPSYTHAANTSDYAVLDENRRFSNILRFFSTPVGSISMYAGTSAPTGWAICHGQTVDFIANPEYLPLFQVIGTSFGAGTTGSQFKLPDLRSRFPVGTSTDYPITSTGGNKEATLIVDNLPNHSHAIQQDGSHRHGIPSIDVARSSGTGHHTGNTSVEFGFGTLDDTSNAGQHNHGGFTGNTGDNLPFSIMPPYLSLNYIIRIL